VDLDREGGGAGVARLVAQKASLDVDEARRIVQAALDDYINSLYRSLRNIEAGRLLEGRLDAGESIGPLLTTAFALEGRVRPFNKWLVVELGKRPLRIDGLLEDAERIAVEASPAAQRRAFLKIDLAARQPATARWSTAGSRMSTGSGVWRADLPLTGPREGQIRDRSRISRLKPAADRLAGEQLVDDHR
jgi:hypothetical protein